MKKIQLMTMMDIGCESKRNWARVKKNQRMLEQQQQQQWQQATRDIESITQVLSATIVAIILVFSLGYLITLTKGDLHNIVLSMF